MGFFFVAFLLTVYFLPMVVARMRQHPNWVAITVLNLLGGWTVVGWVIAMVWACLAIDRNSES